MVCEALKSNKQGLSATSRNFMSGTCKPWITTQEPTSTVLPLQLRLQSWKLRTGKRVKTTNKIYRESSVEHFKNMPHMYMYTGVWNIRVHWCWTMPLLFIAFTAKTLTTRRSNRFQAFPVQNSLNSPSFTFIKTTIKSLTNKHPHCPTTVCVVVMAVDNNDRKINSVTLCNVVRCPRTCDVAEVCACAHTVSLTKSQCINMLILYDNDSIVGVIIIMLCT